MHAPILIRDDSSQFQSLYMGGLVQGPFQVIDICITINNLFFSCILLILAFLTSTINRFLLTFRQMPILRNSTTTAIVGLVNAMQHNGLQAKFLICTEDFFKNSKVYPDCVMSESFQDHLPVSGTSYVSLFRPSIILMSIRFVPPEADFVFSHLYY
jgi:hypothetical protein